MRLRFTIRDLFWLTLVAALLVAWLQSRYGAMQTDDQLKFVQRQRDAVQLRVDKMHVMLWDARDTLLMTWSAIRQHSVNDTLPTIRDSASTFYGTSTHNPRLSTF
jgi:hypothetical protein